MHRRWVHRWPSASQSAAIWHQPHGRQMPLPPRVPSPGRPWQYASPWHARLIDGPQGSPTSARPAVWRQLSQVISAGSPLEYQPSERLPMAPQYGRRSVGWPGAAVS